MTATGSEMQIREISADEIFLVYLFEGAEQGGRATA